MPGWLAKLFPARTLAGVSRPTPVLVDAHVASPNTLVSPLSGYSAALIAWRFLVHYTEQRQQSVERFRLLWACARGEDLVLTTPQGTIFVPSRGREVRPLAKGRGVPLDSPLPPEAAHLAEGTMPGLVFYDELLLRNGDLVRLRAVVAPSAGQRGSAYRSDGAVRADFEALPQLGRVVVQDRPLAG
jgi:hypothetical protein